MTTAANNIIAVFLQAAAANPDDTALSQDGKAVSYRQLKDEVMSAAALYRRRGIGKGDKVLVFVPMSSALYRIVLALFYIGACPVFLDEWVSIARLRECLKVVPCKAFIAKSSYLFLSLFITPLRRVRVRISAAEAGVPESLLPHAEVNGGDTALVTFTTGSTGTPKAADRTHAYLLAQLAALSPLLDNVPSPCMTLLPIVVLLHLASGKTAALPPKRFKAAKPATAHHLTAAIASIKARAIIASPAVVSMLLPDDNTLSSPPLPAAFRHVKSVITGGGPVYPDLAKQLLATFPAAAIIAVYGSTEAEPIAHINAEELSAATPGLLFTRGLPVGLPDVAAEVAILRLDTAPGEITDDSTLALYLELRNVPGEVIVAGDHVLRHYINNPIAEAQTKLHIGGKVWHRTGDCGMLDDAGKLYLLGRCGELFIWKAKSYYPAIITYGLRVLAGVTESAVLLKSGIPFVILEKRDRELLPQIKASLAALQLSDATLQFIKRIPKDPRHQTKVDYAQLRELLVRLR